MSDYVKTAKKTGILFLTAMIASLVGGGLLEPIQENSSSSMLITGVVLEIVNAFAVAGIGFLLFPLFKKYQKFAANIYLIFRIFESLACIAAPLVLVLDHPLLRTFFTGTLIPMFFCSGALVFYSVLFVYSMIPRFISVWGIFGVAGILVLNATNVQNGIGMALALPIILNEIFLGVWLIASGFNQNHLKFLST